MTTEEEKGVETIEMTTTEIIEEIEEEMKDQIKQISLLI